MIKQVFKRRMNLALTLSLFVFVVMLTTFFATGLTAYVLDRLGIIDLNWAHSKDVSDSGASPLRFFLSLFGFCLLLGQALTAFLSKKTLQPIRRVVEATKEVAKGNFNVKVNVQGIYELEELSNSFNKMTDELASIETLKRDFINNFSHEFKTPIVSIRGFAKLLKKGDLSEQDQSDYLDIIISESERLGALSTQILNLANYEHVEIVSDKCRFQLDEQIRKVILMLEPKWTEKNIQLQVDLETAWYFGNEDLTQQIWINLLDNAIKFSHQGGIIDILLRNTHDGWIISIRDEGCGMDLQTTEHIFEKFYRADASHTNSGNGIGLAIVKRLITLIDGVIRVESSPHYGSTFTVELK